MSKQLNEPITDQGIRNTNFFNGRLLTAKDLQTDQEAERFQRWQLGRSIGEGVVEGLEVSLISPGDRSVRPVVGITKGLAINRKGQVLSLPADDQVNLVRRIDLAPPEAGVFGECGLATSTFSNLDKGVYVLVVGPVSTFRERAPMRNVAPNGAAPGCGSKYAVEGVEFDLIKLDISRMTTVSAATRTLIQSLMTLNDAASISRLRNLLAHLCFGTEELLNIPFEPFKQASGKSAYATYGAVDFMRSLGDITDCKVPLALVYWSGASVSFLDMWSVRRCVTQGPTSKRLPPLLDDRRVSEGEAVIRQFEDHAESLRVDQPFPDILLASNFFRYLPPAGILPLNSPGQKGFGVSTFFSGIAHRPPEFIDGSVLRALLGEAVNYQPIDLTNREMVWLYRFPPIAIGPDGRAPDPTHVVFTSPQMPYKATARFDVARWDISNYAKGADCEAPSGGIRGAAEPRLVLR